MKREVIKFELGIEVVMALAIVDSFLKDLQDTFDENSVDAFQNVIEGDLTQREELARIRGALDVFSNSADLGMIGLLREE
jgi:hypothetical protein